MSGGRLTRALAAAIVLVAAAADARAQAPDAGEPSLETERAPAPGASSAGIDYGLARRADVPGALSGDVSGYLGSPAPGRPGSALAGSITGRIGLGLGLFAEFSASRRALDDSIRPGFGIGYQLLGGAGRPLSLSIFGQYRPEGFTEPEGEFEMLVAATLRREALELSANVVAGTDPDGKEGDVEARFAAGYFVKPSILLGGESQSRAGFGEGTGRFGRTQDHQLAGMVQVGIDHFVLTGLLGGAATLRPNDTRFGPSAQARIAYRF